MYVVAGTIGSKGTITSKPDFNGDTDLFEINVPEFLWKVVLIPEYPNQKPQDITENAVTFGIVVPNETQTGNWRTAPFSVNEIEELTGHDFFSDIPENIQEIIEDNSTILF